MQPHQLQYFVAVAETGSFTAGAQRARVVQSAVSVAVRQLEHELKASLFVRGRQIRLTPEGEALLPRAREVLAAMEAATAAVAATREVVTGTVNLGMLFRFATFDMASSLASFQRKHPAVVVRGRSSGEGTRGHLEALRRGDLDLALLATAPGVTSIAGMHLESLGTETLRFVCAASHPLADSGSVRLEQLTDEIFIDLPAGWGNRSLIDSAFADAGLRREVRTETIDFVMGQALAAEELGVTFVPESAVVTDPRITAIDVEPGLAWTVQLAWSARRPLSTAALALATELRECASAQESSITID